jgi:hypothetical protein
MWRRVFFQNIKIKISP